MTRSLGHTRLVSLGNAIPPQHQAHNAVTDDSRAITPQDANMLPAIDLSFAI